MTRDKGIFRRALSALVEGRSRQAQRYVDAYLADSRIRPADKS
jgi:hypothetical protein